LGVPASSDVRPLASQVQAALAAIYQHRLLQPRVAIVLGSGLGSLADEVTHATRVPYQQIPFFQATHASGHAGQLVLGYLAGVPVVLMQGRVHRYEGFATADIGLPIHVMHALGATILLATNAAGGLNPRYRAGDLMLIDQHINCLWSRAQALGPAPALGLAPAATNLSLRSLTQVYDRELLERVSQLALQAKIPLQRGTYVATLGPTYETRAEYRMFRAMGGDAVGMSTVPEVLAARYLGLRCLAISVITNVAMTDFPRSTNHDEVLQQGAQAGPQLRRLVGDFLEDLAGPAD
jgi:purine-nucleoside phosphorylase